MAGLVRDGSAAVRTTYSDGGQNAIFAALLKKGADLGTVSRPEALAYAGIDVTLVPARQHPRPAPKPEPRPEPKPEPVVAAAAVLQSHTAPLPAALEPAALGAAPMHYGLYRPLAVAGLIAGAMPMRAAVWAN